MALGRYIRCFVALHAYLTDFQWLFVALGVISASWGVLMFFWLPDTPANAKFLTPNQRIQAVERVKITNQTVIKSNVFRIDHFFEAITDMKVLLVVLFLVAVTICNSSLTAFSQIVLVGLGFDVRISNSGRLFPTAVSLFAEQADSTDR
jgi:hypothetical protein